MILVVEDNQDLAFGIEQTLEFEGYTVQLAEDGATGLERARSSDVELVILDLMLPRLDGLDVLRQLRRDGLRTPVLVLTARTEESDVLMCFDSGADDYVPKPFSMLELVARVRSILRRGPAQTTKSEAESFQFGSVRVDVHSRTVLKEGKPVDLTPREWDLLLALHRKGGAAASRSQLLKDGWNWANTQIRTRTVDNHIAQLRRKLEDDPSKPRHLLTVNKVGYRLVD